MGPGFKVEARVSILLNWGGDVGVFFLFVMGVGNLTLGVSKGWECIGKEARKETTPISYLLHSGHSL